MKVEYTPESEAEKGMMEIILSAQAKQTHTIDDRVAFLERHAANNILTNMMMQKAIQGLLLDEEEEDEEEEESNLSLINDIENIKRQINLFHQNTLEIEELKVRVRNLESDNARLRRESDDLMKLVNLHADVLERLNCEVFDEEPAEKEKDLEDFDDADDGIDEAYQWGKDDGRL